MKTFTCHWSSADKSFVSMMLQHSVSCVKVKSSKCNYVQYVVLTAYFGIFKVIMESNHTLA
jgi:hypothetical protein